VITNLENIFFFFLTVYPLSILLRNAYHFPFRISEKWHMVVDICIVCILGWATKCHLLMA